MPKKLTPTQEFVRTARSLGVDILTPREWRSKRRAVYALRRRVRKHKLIPAQPVDTLWQHITVTRDTGKHDASFKNDMRTVEGIGFDRFLSGCSYNVCIDMSSGLAGMGQPLDAKGTHTVNDKNIPGYSKDQNYVSLAFAFIGMPGDTLTEDAKLTVSRLIAAAMICGFLTEGFDYNPHALVAWKSCPTPQVIKEMGEIKEKAHQIYRRHKEHKKHQF